MKQFYRVTLTITPPPIMRQAPYTLYYRVEAWDADDAENRARAQAVRERGAWREWTKATVEQPEGVNA